MYGDDYDDISAIKRIADEFGIAILLVHHLRKLKDSNDPFNQISGSTGIIGAVDTAFLLKKEAEAEDTATLIAKGRDIELQQLRLRFEDRRWELLERKNQEELKEESIPDFVFRLAEFVKRKGEWTGTATELVDEMAEKEVSFTSVTKLISRFYYEVFEPKGIHYYTKRTGTHRLIKLKLCDSSDGNDSKIAIQKKPSLLSQPSQQMYQQALLLDSQKLILRALPLTPHTYRRRKQRENFLSLFFV